MSHRKPVPVTAAPRLAALALTVLLAACGGGGGSSSWPPGGTGTPGANSGPSYDVVALGIPDVYGDITPRSIANGGVVALTSWGGAGGNPRAFLYNGSTSVDLGTLGGAFARAQAVTPCGHVTGWSGRADGGSHAFLYDGAMHDLGALGGTGSAAYAISGCGYSTGWAATADGQTHAFLYDGKTMRDLGAFGGDSSGVASNKVGQVVGYAYGPGNAWYHAFLYDARSGAPIQDLGSPGGNSSAAAINDAGQIVGSWRVGTGPVGAFMFEAGKMRDLGTLGGKFAEATGINGAGIVVGNSALADGSQRGFVYDGKSMRSIGALGSGTFSQAVAINANGLVVGSAIARPGGDEHAISWTAKDGIVDLNAHMHDAPAGLVLVTALAVADDGNIAVRTNHGLALLKLRH